MSALLSDLAAECDQVVACAAKIGGISYFHAYAYDLLAENERIVAATFGQKMLLLLYPPRLKRLPPRP